MYFFGYYYCCVCVCVTCIYNLLSLFSFVCMYMCPGLTTWDWDLCGSLSLKETDSASFSRLWSLVVLHLKVGHCVISPFLFDMPTDGVIMLTLFIFLEIHRYSFPSLSREYLTADILSLCTLIICSLYLYDSPWALGIGVTLQMYQLGLGTSQTLILCILANCGSLW